MLQVNYRGSTGFGARFLRLGMNGRFNRSLQDDIVDAVRYATTSNGESPRTESAYTAELPPLPWGDPNKLAIMGSSFGGYSALWGMTSYPGLYRCAVAICPMISVGAADKESKRAYRGSPVIAKYWQRVFGKNISMKRATARRASPVYQIRKVQGGSAIALYHGENDPRSPLRNSQHFLGELKRCAIAGEIVKFAGEGHGISKDSNRLYMYYRIEAFLCRYFGMEAFDAGDAEKMEGNTGTVTWSAKFSGGQNRLK